jgi:transcriptional regulator with XRE-family HTH domain
MYSVGKIIKQGRISKGYTQERLADMVGVKQTFISAIEKNIKKPSIELGAKLCEILEIPGEQIIGKHVVIEQKSNSWTMEFLKRLVEEGLINDPDDIPEEHMNMILYGIKQDIKRMQKEKTA